MSDSEVMKQVDNCIYDNIIQRMSNSFAETRLNVEIDQLLVLMAANNPFDKPRMLILERSAADCKTITRILNEYTSKNDEYDRWYLISSQMTDQEVSGDIVSSLSGTMHFFYNANKNINFILPVNKLDELIPDKREYQEAGIILAEGEKIQLNKLLSKINELGYWRSASSLEPGNVKVRGENIEINHPASRGNIFLTFYGSNIEKIELEYKGRRVRQHSIALLPVKFPERTISLRNSLIDYVLFTPSHVEVRGQTIIYYDSLQPDLSFPKVRVPDLLRFKRRQKIKEVSYKQGIAMIANLKAGKPAVHADHGIGIFEGLQERQFEEVTKEYLILRYAAGDTLSVPVQQAYKVTAYLGEDTPVIHRLSGNVWSRAKRAAKRDAEEFARNILNTAGKRKASSGHEYVIENKVEEELEKSFPYTLTEDQTRAWEDVKSDMKSGEVMDRLIIGDVGFGKTELAIRAARHVIANGKQVALLAPTTLLVQQHSDTFSARLKEMQEKIGTLSRFSNLREKKKTALGISSGEVMIVIGTHALLSDNISWQNLGLVIIDEEQRFGVAQKEKFKKIRASVDILSLSATPIPRTLSMSLSGLKQLSIIQSPPEGRKNVTTYVGRDEDAILSSAIRKELQRNGQVYVVTPRISELNPLAHRIHELVPEAKCDVIHGQLPNNTIAAVMKKFDNQETQVLISSTIIENGLDLPNANTMIVMHATRLGLADLYQLRGRIGRREKQGHAYFLYNQTRLTAVQRKRLAALTEASRLGSGWSVAQRDLEIRGAGNLLGAEQSGSVNAVGVQLYLDMIQNFVDQEQSLDVRRGDVEILLPFAAGISKKYIADVDKRTRAYQVLARAKTVESLREEAQLLQQQYGSPEEQFINLVLLLKLQHRAAQLGILKIESKRITPFDDDEFFRIYVSAVDINKVSRVLPRNCWAVEEDVLVHETRDLSQRWLKRFIGQLKFAGNESAHS